MMFDDDIEYCEQQHYDVLRCGDSISAGDWREEINVYKLANEKAELLMSELRKREHKILLHKVKPFVLNVALCQARIQAEKGKLDGESK